MRISINFFKKIVICSLALFFAFGTKGSAQGNAQSFVTLPSSKSPLVNAVKEAAKKFQVPDRLLLAMAYEGRRFSGGNCKGCGGLAQSGDKTNETAPQKINENSFFSNLKIWFFFQSMNNNFSLPENINNANSAYFSQIMQLPA